MGLLAQQTGDVTHNRTTVGRLGCRRRHLQRTFAIPLRNQVGWRNVKVFRQGQGHSFGAAVGQSKVVARIANSIRMPFDQDYSTWVFLDRITDDGPDFGQRTRLFGLDRGGTCCKAHGVQFDFRC